MQENKAREMAEMKRRHRDRLQIAAKRRSTATCSSRDKEMDGIALESMLHNFLTNRVSRRRPGRPSSTHGSPTSGSPNNGSLSEITSQANLPTGNQNRGDSFRAKEMGRKEWNSAAELTENSSNKNIQSNSKDKKAKCGIPHGEETKTPAKEDSDNRIPIPFQGRAFSTTTDDGEEDLQDNNEAEAQRLREASKKVLRFQNSRGSVSSGDYSLENQKSPGPSSALPRQRTFDEETQRYPGDPTNEDLVRFLLNPQSPSKHNLSRRHTLSTMVPKTEEVEDNLWVQPTGRTPNPAARDTGMQAESAGHNSNQVFDFTGLSHNFRKSGASDQNSPSAERKSKPNVSLTHAPADEGLGEQNQEGKSVELTGTRNHLQRNSENIPPKSTWIKTETSGLFFSFLKRLGDMSKLQNSKETVHKGSDSDV